ncbi:MAG TPA: GNAT family N-acetyltransferase [Chloroflexota bacterium]|nr:GNAT family N-acetyltransferase [Chloroflexota bacterium]
MTSRFSGRSLADHAEKNPDLGLVASSGRQYIVAGQWRRRPDIAELIEASPGDGRGELLDRLCRTLVGKGFVLAVLDYSLGARDPGFFRRHGFTLIERILEYERPAAPVVRQPFPDGFLVRPYTENDRVAILALERESFPWLWWNSDPEWDSYVANIEVEIFVGTFEGEVVGYAGFVMFRHEGHLDRLAVHRNYHGRRFGASLLAEALGRMTSRGASRIALTTQEDNVRSQRLYEQNGFRRARWTYEIHGKWLAPREGPPS